MADLVSPTPNFWMQDGHKGSRLWRHFLKIDHVPRCLPSLFWRAPWSSSI